MAIKKYTINSKGHFEMNKDFYPHRSALYMPGSNERALEKAKTLAADLFIFDFEDAVSPENKGKARDLVANVLTVQKSEYGQKKILTRVNSIESEWGMLDLEAIKSCKTDGIIFPKVNELKDVKRIKREMSKMNFSNETEIWIMVETPKALAIKTAVVRECINPSLFSCLGKPSSLAKSFVPNTIPERPLNSSNID